MSYLYFLGVDSNKNNVLRKRQNNFWISANNSTVELQLRTEREITSPIFSKRVFSLKNKAEVLMIKGILLGKQPSESYPLSHCFVHKPSSNQRDANPGLSRGCSLGLGFLLFSGIFCTTLLCKEPWIKVTSFEFHNQPRENHFWFIFHIVPDLDVLKVRILKTETRVALAGGLKLSGIIPNLSAICRFWAKENLTDKLTHQENEANNSLIWNTWAAYGRGRWGGGSNSALEPAGPQAWLPPIPLTALYPAACQEARHLS